MDQALNMTEQLKIKDWFDSNYKRWGFTYLRPLQAYEIFGGILNPNNGDTHLDVACGLGLLLKVMSKRGAICDGIDLSSEAVKKAREFCPEASIQEANAEELPFPDQTFNTISCIGSLERMLDREKALKEQMRVLKEEGRLCIMVRNSEHFVWKYFWKPFGIQNKKGHQDALNLAQWTELFESVGLKVETVYPDHWPYYKVIRFLKPKRAINYAKVLKFPMSIRLAYEFIFVLKKA